MKRRYWILALALVMALVMAACGKKGAPAAAGRWDLITMEDSEETIDVAEYADLLGPSYLQLNEDKTGEMVLFGESDAVTYDDKNISLDGDKAPYVLEGDTLTITVEDGDESTKLVFRRGTADGSSSAASTGASSGSVFGGGKTGGSDTEADTEDEGSSSATSISSFGAGIAAGSGSASGLTGTAATYAEGTHYDAGTYVLYEFSSPEDGDFTRDDLLNAGVDMYLIMNEDGTGKAQMIDSYYLLAWHDGMVYMYEEGAEDEGSENPYTTGGNEYIVMVEDGGTYTTFIRTDDVAATGADSGSAEDEEEGVDYDLIADFEGDWHGLMVYDEAGGDYASLAGKKCDVVARFSFDEDGTVRPYMAAALANEIATTLNFEDLTASMDQTFDCMDIAGQFYDMELDSFLWLESDGLMTMETTVYEDAGDGYVTFRLAMRRLDDPWLSTDEPRYSDEGFAYYKGKDLMQILDTFEVYPTPVPELTNVGETGGSGSSSGAGSSSGSASAGGAGEYVSQEALDRGLDPDLFGEGIADAQTLAEAYLWLSEQDDKWERTDIIPKLTEMIGVKPSDANPRWDNMEKAYFEWKVPDGGGNFFLNFDILENGDLELAGYNNSGSVNEAYQELQGD